MSVIWCWDFVKGSAFETPLAVGPERGYALKEQMIKQQTSSGQLKPGSIAALEVLAARGRGYRLLPHTDLRDIDHDGQEQRVCAFDMQTI